MKALEILKNLSTYGEMPLNAQIFSFLNFQFKQETYPNDYFFSGSNLELDTYYVIIPACNDCPEAYYLFGQRSAWCGWDGSKYMVFPIAN